MRGALGGGSDHRQATPRHHVEREQDPRGNELEREVLRDLSDRVADGETGVDFVEVVACHAECFLHARYIGIRAVVRGMSAG